jgi:hypothetical protein
LIFDKVDIGTQTSPENTITVIQLAPAAKRMQNVPQCGNQSHIGSISGGLSWNGMSLSSPLTSLLSHLMG